MIVTRHNDGKITLSGEMARCFLIFSWANGDEYTGDWKEGVPNGHGEFLYGPSDQIKMGDKYVGNFVNGHKHGYATYYYNDGRSFVGKYQVSCSEFFKRQNLVETKSVPFSVAWVSFKIDFGD